MKQSTPPASLRRRIAAVVASQALAQPGDTVIIGVSGGPDSVALLHILCSGLPFIKCIAVYIDHGLRPDETGAEIELVQTLSHQLQAGFEQISVDVKGVALHDKTSIEETARILRYQALESMRRQYQGTAIAVAHTADDQAEELLIRLIRGSGKKGLSGMQLHNGRIIRPLLHECKATLLHYLQAQQIPFCIDSSNLERTYLRNRVRLDLLPYLQKNFNNSIKQTLFQTAQILTDEEVLLEELTETAYLQVVSMIETKPVHSGTPLHSLRIKTKDFCACHPAIQRRILEKCCWQMDERPQFKQIELLLDLFYKGKTGAEIHLSKGLRAHKTPETVIFSYPVGKRSYRGKV